MNAKKFFIWSFAISFVLFLIGINTSPSNSYKLTSEQAKEQQQRSDEAIAEARRQQSIAEENAKLEREQNMVKERESALNSEPVNIPDFFKAYSQNTIAADNKFKNKLIKINAIVHHVTIDDKGTPYIRAMLFGDGAKGVAVQLNYKKDNIDTLSNLTKMDLTTSLCFSKGRLSDYVEFYDCELLTVNKKKITP